MGTHADLTAGLRRLADFLDDHDNFPKPYSGSGFVAQANIYTPATAEDLPAILASGPVSVDEFGHDGARHQFRWDFGGGVALTWIIPSDLIGRPEPSTRFVVPTLDELRQTAPLSSLFDGDDTSAAMKHLASKPQPTRPDPSLTECVPKGAA